MLGGPLRVVRRVSFMCCCRKSSQHPRYNTICARFRCDFQFEVLEQSFGLLPVSGPLGLMNADPKRFWVSFDGLP